MKIRKSELKKLIREEASRVSASGNKKVLSEARLASPMDYQERQRLQVARAHIMFAHDRPTGSILGIVEAALSRGNGVDAIQAMLSAGADGANAAYEAFMSGSQLWSYGPTVNFDGVRSADGDYEALRGMVRQGSPRAYGDQTAGQLVEALSIIAAKKSGRTLAR